MFENPIKFDISKAPEHLQLELIDLQANNNYKNNFDEGKLILFYSSLPENKFPQLKTFAKSIICIFGSTYLCEQTFSRMNNIKSKYRTRLTDQNLHNILRISVTQTNVDIIELSKMIQEQRSH